MPTTMNRHVTPSLCRLPLKLYGVQTPYYMQGCIVHMYLTAFAHWLLHVTWLLACGPVHNETNISVWLRRCNFLICPTAICDSTFKCVSPKLYMPMSQSWTKGQSTQNRKSLTSKVAAEQIKWFEITLAFSDLFHLACLHILSSKRDQLFIKTDCSLSILWPLLKSISLYVNMKREYAKPGLNDALLHIQGQ